MKKSTISTEKKRRVSPGAAFVLSLLWTGAGEFRYGRKSAGTVLALLRVLPLLLMPVLYLQDSGGAILFPLIAAAAWALLLTLASPPAFLFSLRGQGTIPEEKITSPIFLVLFILLSTALTIGTLTLTCSFFSIHRVAGDDMKPGFSRGDCILIAAVPEKLTVHPGSVVMAATDGGMGLYRVITTRAVTVKEEKGAFTLPGGTLTLTAPDDETTALFETTPGENLLVEENGTRRYPVLVTIDKTENKKKKKETDTVMVKTGQLLVARDDRRKENFYRLISRHEIRFSVLGKLIPAGGFGPPQLPWL